MHILGIVGSLRKQSYNRALLEAFAARIPEGTTMELASVDLPLYNGDIEDPLPESVRALKEQVERADALIIASPEYNRSVPGVLKNAIDWLSRPHGSNSLTQKRILVVGASPGTAGATVAQYALKQSLLHLNALVLGQPEFFLGGAKEKFDEQLTLTDEKTLGYVDAAIRVLTEYEH